jgi:phosphate transport system permease protein
VASEFSGSFLGRILRGLLGVLAGIPPIVYAVIGIVFMRQLLIIPNFSTLTGGLLLAMLAIPFMTPLIDDAIRNVPNHLKEGSLALGATRWHTLQKVVLPAALPGIISAAGLGALKSTGDIMIAIWAVGYAPSFPAPFWDILSHPAPLTATSASFVGGASVTMVDTTPNTVGWIEYSVSYFYGIVLLILALFVMVLVTILQRIFKKRLS